MNNFQTQIDEMHQAILNEDDGYLEILEELVELAKAPEQYDCGLTVHLLKHLIRQMIDGATLPLLDEEEITDLATRAEEGLIPYILEVNEYASEQEQN